MRRTDLLTLMAALIIAAGILPRPRAAAEDVASEPSPLEVFEQRIMPIFRSAEPSSCVQCHLAAVDLKDYILPSHKETFASLRDQGLIDVERPERSKILALIQMGEDDRDQGARLIHEETRRAEYEAFAAWITACCRDPEIRGLPRVNDSQRAAPERPNEIIRYARKDRVLDSFVRNVWSQRMRCYPCHTPHEIDESNTQHRPAIERSREFVAQFGDRMHIFRETPEATMAYLIEESRRRSTDSLSLVNLDHPSQSLIVVKPTSKPPVKDADGQFEEPSSVHPVTHMGGKKMHLDDHSYKSFVAWIQDYARVSGNKYATVDELPRDNWYPTQHVLMIRGAPEAWPDGAVVQLFVHAPSGATGGTSWESEPIAFTQGRLNPRRMVNGMLFMIASDDAAAASSWDGTKVKLPPGEYLVKAYVDQQGRLADEPTLMLGREEFAGELEIDAKWGEGYREAEIHQWAAPAKSSPAGAD